MTAQGTCPDCGLRPDRHTDVWAHMSCGRAPAEVTARIQADRTETGHRPCCGARPPAHQWDCPVGRAGWRRDGYTATVDGAAAHAALHGRDTYDPAEDRPDRSEM